MFKKKTWKFLCLKSGEIARKTFLKNSRIISELKKKKKILEISKLQKLTICE